MPTPTRITWVKNLDFGGQCTLLLKYPGVESCARGLLIASELNSSDEGIAVHLKSNIVITSSSVGFVWKMIKCDAVIGNSA